MWRRLAILPLRLLPLLLLILYVGGFVFPLRRQVVRSVASPQLAVVSSSLICTRPKKYPRFFYRDLRARPQCTSNHESGADHYDHCDPLDATLCALPFPSSFFLEEDEEAPRGSSAPEGTGYRVAFGPESLPFTRGRKNVSPVALNAYDGFSTVAPILFYLEVGLAVGGSGASTRRMLLFLL